LQCVCNEISLKTTIDEIVKAGKGKQLPFQAVKASDRNVGIQSYIIKASLFPTLTKVSPITIPLNILAVLSSKESNSTGKALQ